MTFIKLEINYDLLKKICIAEKGINLQRMAVETFAITGFISLLSVMFNKEDIKQIVGDVLYAFFLTSLRVVFPPVLCAPKSKQDAIDELKDLSVKLSQLKVSTDEELLLQSEIYEIKYKINYDNGMIPRLQQNKYILVPTHNDGEVSLLQEHIIGNREYSLSVGEPERKKQFRLAYNGI